MTTPEPDPLAWLLSGRDVEPRPICPEHPGTAMLRDGKGGWECPSCRTQRAMFKGAARQERRQE